MQKNLFSNTGDEKLLNDLFQAYFNARKNKRNTINAIRFEKHFERNLFELYDKISAYQYEPNPSICFVVDKPVKREIFAADFRDRVVHHLLFNYLSPIFEKTFINDSYSCRKGKGTHFGIRRIDHFIRSCTDNYCRNGYILKLDIKGYFMSINQILLFEKIKEVLLNPRQKPEFDLNLILFLLEKVIFNDPTINCIVKGRKSDWEGLPASKSLFRAGNQKGLPIGNLTSQLFGNVYLNDFDHFVKRELGIKYYGRYVDDFVLIHPDINYLKSLIPVIRDYLKENLHLDLHPDKVYLQHYSKGVKYLGVVILPHRNYVANRTKGNFYHAIVNQNKVARDHKPSDEEKVAFQSSMNSYLGILKHYKTYKIRKSMLFKNLNAWWWNYAYLKGGYAKFVLKN
ncbi:MAG: reverse transcriptase/maturase family protein [Bacteroidales bacterium]|nr:reverse transcriptase/maturase family protein [Bacteroidales bacterium]